MTMITPSYLGETIEYSSLHACRSTLEDPTVFASIASQGHLHSNRTLLQDMLMPERVEDSIKNRIPLRRGGFGKQ